MMKKFWWIWGLALALGIAAGFILATKDDLLSIWWFGGALGLLLISILINPE